MKYNIYENLIKPYITNAHKLSNVATDLESVAFIRLVLAVLQKAYKPMSYKDIGAILESGRLDIGLIDGYIKPYYDKFWLFHETDPFFQVIFPGISIKKAMRHWSETISYDHLSSNSAVVVCHNTPKNLPNLSYEQAFKKLLTTFMYTPNNGDSISGQTSKSPSYGCALVIHVGKTVFETLVMNMVPYKSEEACDNDKPIWEKSYSVSQSGTKYVQSPDTDFITGPACLYTWRTRSVFLIDTGTDVKDLILSQGVRESPYNPVLVTNPDHDPMAAYKNKINSGSTKMIPVMLSNEKDIWRQYDSIMLGLSNCTKPATMETVSFLSNNYDVTPLSSSVVGLVIKPGQSSILGCKRSSFSMKNSSDMCFMSVMTSCIEHIDEVGTDVHKDVWLYGCECVGGKNTDAVKNFISSITFESDFYKECEHIFTSTLDNLNYDYEDKVRLALIKCANKFICSNTNDVKSIKAAAKMVNHRKHFKVKNATNKS